jgi:hypothetical protein
MANMRYHAFFAFGDPKKDYAGGTSVIRAFEVDGGAVRRINLDTPDEMDIGSEMEQAKTYKNIKFYLPPTRGIEIAQLGKLFTEKTSLKILFEIMVFSGKTKTKSLALSDEAGIIVTQPTPVGEKTSVEVKVSIPNANLLHTSYPSRNVTQSQKW